MSDESKFPQGFPRFAVPLVDEDGKVSDPWTRLLVSLWKRTGSGLGSNVEVTRAVADLATLLTGDDGVPPQDVQLLLQGLEHDAPSAQSLIGLFEACDFPQTRSILEHLTVGDDAPNTSTHLWLTDPGEADPDRDDWAVFGKVPGQSYATWDGNIIASVAMAALNTLYLHPFFLEEDVYITGLATRVVTGAAGALLKAGIWMNRRGKPVGSPIIFDNAGVSAASSGVAPFTITPTALRKGWYWGGVKAGTAAPTCTAITGTSTRGSSLMGGQTTSTGLVNSATTQLAGRSVADTYANNLPNLTGVSLSDVTAASGMPVLEYTVG